MEFFKTMTQNPMRFLKSAGVIFIGLAVVVVALNVMVTTRGGLDDLAVGTQKTSEMRLDESMGVPSLSMRNVIEDEMLLQSPDGGYTPGDTAEAFEVKEYNVRIETRNLDRDCGVVRALRERDDVIFENTSEYERGCAYAFKVRRGSVEDVLGVIASLDPRELSENAYTIKREIDDFTSEVQILENKLASLDATLKDAATSYGNITALATSRGDVESLAKIIESKLIILERLTSSKIETVNQLERVNRAKAEALDRLEYTHMTVSVYETVFADIENIKDSWKSTVREFVLEANSLAQDVSVGLVVLILTLAKFALYFFVLLFVAKFGWAFTRKNWND